MKNKYWKFRKLGEDYVLVSGIWKVSRNTQMMYLKLARKMVDEMVSVYATVVTRGGVQGMSRAELYRYDRYYEMLEDIKKELAKFGIKYESYFDNELKEMYKDSAIETGRKLEEQGIKSSFNNLDRRAEAAARSIWCADGKSWSQRIWNNLSALQEYLQEALPTAVATGLSAVKLESELMNKFSVSQSRAQSLVVTELSHIYNDAAIDRMNDAGIKQAQWYTSQNEKKVCEQCKENDGKVFELKEAKGLIPLHPRCECTWLAVIPTPQTTAKK